jgi:outer membrane murein-binding lipoprotein Lpp
MNGAVVILGAALTAGTVLSPCADHVNAPIDKVANWEFAAENVARLAGDRL